MTRMAAAIAAVLSTSTAVSSEDARYGIGAIMRGLDTITGRVSEFEVAVGRPQRFDRLSIRLDECRYLPENPAVHSYGYVVIDEIDSGETLFSAWMIASAPALSAMDHHRYDVWLVRCKSEAVVSEEG